MAELEFRRAIWEALDESLAGDERVIFFGEDVAAAGGVFQVTPDLLGRHGPDRVFDTPISELALAAAAFGSAVCGKRPVIEIMFADFIALAMDSLVNQAAKYWYMSNEQGCVPLVVRSSVGGGGRFGAIHSQIPAPWFHAVPGLKIVAPATPADAKGLLKAAIEDDNPVLFFEHKRLYALKGDGGNGAPIRLGEARIARAGDDLTIATAMRSVHEAIRAADSLADRGVDVEVVDLRTLRPFDVDAVVASVVKTNRLLVIEEGPRTGGWAGELVAAVAERALDELDDAWRLAMPDLPLPYSPPLEDAVLPGAELIVNSILERTNGN